MKPLTIQQKGTQKSERKTSKESACTWKLVEERRKLKPKRRENAESSRHYNFLCREIKSLSPLDKGSYLRSLSERVEKAHMQKKSKEIYDGVSWITGERASKVRVIKYKNGKVLTDLDQIKKHFEELYNRKTDRSISTPGDASGWSEQRSNIRNHNRGSAGSRSQTEKLKAPGALITTAEEIQAAGNGCVVLFTG